jgi:acetyl esterase/lipase
MSDAQIKAAIRAMGNVFTNDTLAKTIELYMPLQARAPFEDVEIERDLRYGPDERHRLDIFKPKRRSNEALPVLVFVHGGGFVRGDKSRPDSPFYDNVGVWAVRHGMIGVTMTYRLAPAHRAPAGSEDVSAALRWLSENIGERGGDAQRIFVMGQSAGAAHVAGFIARELADPKPGWRPAGAILISGLYDTATMEKNEFFEAYFGKDPEVYLQHSSLERLARTSVPLMVAIAEFDPPDFLRQGMLLLDTCLRNWQQLPRFVQLAGHNHLSTVLHLNTEEGTFSRQLQEFVQQAGAAA